MEVPLVSETEPHDKTSAGAEGEKAIKGQDTVSPPQGQAELMHGDVRCDTSDDDCMAALSPNGASQRCGSQGLRKRCSASPPCSSPVVSQSTFSPR